MRTDKLGREVAAIGDLPREELVERWIKAYGTPPPKGIKRGLLVRSAAWHLQKRRLGGPSLESGRKLKVTMRRLDAARRSAAAASDDGYVKSAAARKVAAASSPTGQETACTDRRPRSALKPGTRLIRDWNGRANVVEVTEAGFVHDGRTFRSLSAIARHITGARWSGPRFFGL